MSDVSQIEVQYKKWLKENSDIVPMTKREMIAAMCLQAIITARPNVRAGDAAHEAVQFADKLLLSTKRFE